MEILNLNLNLLKAFWAVYREGGINKAAKLLMLEPPTVTYSIKQLEQQLGHKLFVTSKRGTVPTKEADIMFPLVDGSFASLLRGKEQLEALRGSGTIRVGLPVLVANFFLAEFFRDFTRRYSDVNLEFYHDGKNDYMGMLSASAVDVIFAFSPESEDSSFKFVEIRKIESVFYSSKEFAQRNNFGNRLMVCELEKLPLIIHAKSTKRIDRLEKDFDIKTNTVKVPSVNMTLDMVANGQGIGLLFEDYLDAQKDRGFVKFLLDGNAPLTDVLKLVYDEKKTSSVLKLLIRELRTYISFLNK
jgi:DNA-binding transcriptional LysR family regulator